MGSDGRVSCAVLGAWGRRRRATASGSAADAAACTPLPLCGFVRSILPPLTMVESVFTRSASERLHARGAKVQKVWDWAVPGKESGSLKGWRPRELAGVQNAKVITCWHVGEKRRT